jgi:chemotaxis protein MotB
MSAGGGRRKKGHASGHNDERWLLTYSDMITLLMALFIIMWAISTVNDSKFDQLSKSLSDAFGGSIFQGNKKVIDGSSGSKAEIVPTRPNESTSSTAKELTQAVQNAAAARELENLKALKAEVDAYVGAKGLSGKIDTSIDERGLVIRILPDDMLFDTGEAELRPEARPVLGEIARLLRGLDGTNPVHVEGNTDNVPISTDRFRNNWELSAGRAVTVLTFLEESGFDPTRMSAIGYGEQRPVASNATAAGRALNRRVEIVVVRQAVAQAEPSGDVEVVADAGIGGAGIGELISPIGEEVVSP